MQIAKISGQNSALLLMETVFDIVSLHETSVIGSNYRLKKLVLYTVIVDIIKSF